MHQTAFAIVMLVRLVEGAEYLVALPHSSFKSPTPYVNARTDETGGTLYCADPNFDWVRSVDILLRDSRSIYFHSRVGTFSKIENKAISIACSKSDASVQVIGRYFSFAPLPITALGTKYIVSACGQSIYYSLLIIAAYNLTTTVSITTRSPIFGPSFNYVDKQKFELKPFQTFTFQHHSDLSGTVITSTQPIAVFSGMVNSSDVKAYEQLLPVRLFDKEYVVAVDDNPALYQLQILSEQNGTEITFNNDSSLTMQDNVHQYFLKLQESLYFKSSNPVMTTICRRNGTQGGFMVVPPVSLYSLRVVNLNRNSIFMTHKETFINSSDIRWTHIPNSGYKTGVLLGGSITTKVHGCNLVFLSSSIRTDGVTNTQSCRIEKKKSYLVAVLNQISIYQQHNNNVNLQLSSLHAAMYQVVFPHHNQTNTRQMTAISSDNFYIENEMIVQNGVENKAIRVDVDTEETQLIIQESDYHFIYRSPLATIFPTTLLGQEYIVPTCYGNMPSESRVIIVSSSMKTDINVLLSKRIMYDGVEYRPGDTIREHLQPHQTLTINSYGRLCGTSVSASHNVAVFTYKQFGELSPDYNQLLPVEEFGQDYIVSTSDQGNVGYNHDFENPISVNSRYYVLVTSATNLTQVQFSDNLLVTVAKGVSYHKELQKNESLQFYSTKPVMVSLCSEVSANFETEELHQSRCTVIVPTSLYTTKSRFMVSNSTIKILTGNIDANITLIWSDTTHVNVSVDITWDIYNGFKIGTTTVTYGQILISSTHKFTTICFSTNDRNTLLSYGSIVGVILNPLGWNYEKGNLEDQYVSTTASQISETDGKSGDMPTSGQGIQINITAVATGITLGVLILFPLAVIICQQINKAHKERWTGASFSRDQPQDGDVAAVSSAAIYFELETDTNATNIYENINPLFCHTQGEYENEETKL